MSWCLFALACNPGVQQKLREELLAVPTENPTIDELNALPYLEAVVRESSRLHPAIPYTMRSAVKDDVVPLSDPYTDVHGKVHHELQYVFLPRYRAALIMMDD